jgi:hypothetical protein
LTLVGKGYSAATVDSDPFNTMVTKQWTEEHVAIYATQWDRIGQTIVTKDAQINIVPNGPAQLGLTANRWLHTFTDAITVTNKATSASTVDADAANTLVTKDYLLSKVGGVDLNASGAIVLGDGCATSTINLNGATTVSCDMVPAVHNTRDLGTNANRFKAIYAQDVFTGDLHLKNERGSWTLIEEDDCLTMRNNKTGKRYAISMTPYPG